MIRKLIDWIKKQIWLHKPTYFTIKVAEAGEIEAEVKAQYAGNQALNEHDAEF